MMGLCGNTRRITLLAAAITLSGAVATASAGAALKRTEARRPAKPGTSCKAFTIRRNDGSGVTTMYRFSGVRAVRVQCDTVRRVLRDDLAGSGRPLGPSADWGESVDGWTVMLTAAADGYRGRAQFHAGLTIAAVG